MPAEVRSYPSAMAIDQEVASIGGRLDSLHPPVQVSDGLHGLPGFTAQEVANDADARIGRWRCLRIRRPRAVANLDAHQHQVLGVGEGEGVGQAPGKVPVPRLPESRSQRVAVFPAETASDRASGLKARSALSANCPRGTERESDESPGVPVPDACPPVLREGGHALAIAGKRRPS